MLECQEAGHSCWTIARILNDEGVGNPRTGRPWYYGTVRVILETAERRAS